MSDLPSEWSMVSAIITMAGGVYSFTKRYFDRRADRDEKVFWNVVNPAYNILEPFLFQEISEVQYNRILRQLLDLGKATKPYSYENLLPYIEMQIQTLSERTDEGEARKAFINRAFCKLCASINEQYDLYLKKLRLPRRKNLYLLLHEIHENKFQRFKLLLKEKAIAVLLLVLCAIVMGLAVVPFAYAIDGIYRLLFG